MTDDEKNESEPRIGIPIEEFERELTRLRAKSKALSERLVVGNSYQPGPSTTAELLAEMSAVTRSSGWAPRPTRARAS